MYLGDEYQSEFILELANPALAVFADKGVMCYGSGHGPPLGSFPLSEACKGTRCRQDASGRWLTLGNFVFCGRNYSRFLSEGLRVVSRERRVESHIRGRILEGVGCG